MSSPFNHKISKKLGLKATKYTFADYVITDDRTWTTEKRNEWAEKSKQSRLAIINKYGCGYPQRSVTNQD